MEDVLNYLYYFNSLYGIEERYLAGTGRESKLKVTSCMLLHLQLQNWPLEGARKFLQDWKKFIGLKVQMTCIQFG